MEPQQITPKESSKFMIPGAIVIAGALIAGAIYAGGAKAPAGSQNMQAKEPKLVAVSEKDHILGSRSAKVTIVEYSDTECPFCKVYHNTMKQIMSDYEGKVAWVYRHLPIPQLHARATMEAEATECVAELGGNQAFWTYLDSIFETTRSNDSLDPAQLPILARAAGVDVTAFNTCLSSGKYTEKVEKSAKEGFESGAKGTPFSLIVVNGKIVGTVNGAEPIAQIKAKIDAALK